MTKRSRPFHARRCHALIDVLGRNRDVNPTPLCDGFRAADVLVELPSVGSVVVALVLHSDLDVLPTHIEDRDDLPVFVIHGDLGLWRRESRADEKQSQPCLAGRLGACVDQGQGTTGTSDARRPL